MRYDEIRAEELGGRGETGRACDGTAGLGSPGEHRGTRGGAITTLQRTKGGRECVYTNISIRMRVYACLYVCGLCPAPFLQSLPPAMTSRPVNVTAANWNHWWSETILSLRMWTRWVKAVAGEAVSLWDAELTNNPVNAPPADSELQKVAGAKFSLFEAAAPKTCECKYFRSLAGWVVSFVLVRFVSEKKWVFLPVWHPLLQF